MAEKGLDEAVYNVYGELDAKQFHLLSAAIDAVAKPVHAENPGQEKNEAQIINKVVKERTASRGKDMSVLMSENCKRKTPSNRSTATKLSDDLRSKISSFNRANYLSAQERQIYSNDASKVQKYEEVKASMESGLRANALQPQQAKKTSAEEIDEDFERWVMAQKTGLDYGNVARKVIGIHKIKGVLFHWIQWENTNTAAEWIPGKLLRKKYPHVLIEFYESHAYQIDISPLLKKRKTE
ncbi:hypothetical protein B4U80_13111 [Leptotrombidium deliense]|uniref:Chromo shadow domain-containing protein n=1 Tax=Leptotrombidium deliense TaxID=299467 RepID=A0A443SCB8_9ACAR|nr:hypothetical protein B4U80_13111 [Leptotrombidium deliense]